jgi:hypothetical protein
MSAADIEHMLTSCDQDSDRLSKWEQDFIESLAEQWEERGTLSERQREILERIYEEKTR